MDNFEIKPRTFKRILVAVDEDDSLSSVKAFNYAVTTAKRLNTPLGIVSILESNDINIFDSLDPDAMRKRSSKINYDIANYVNKAKSFGLNDIQAFSGEGVPSKVILENVFPKFKPDLLVCGSKTKPVSKMQNIFIGSQASALAQNAPCSVIVVR